MAPDPRGSMASSLARAKRVIQDNWPRIFTDDLIAERVARVEDGRLIRTPFNRPSDVSVDSYIAILPKLWAEVQREQD